MSPRADGARACGSPPALLVRFALKNPRLRAITRTEMDLGLYIAASGMVAEQTRQAQLSNDLANASTPGYKADESPQHSFGELLLSNTATGQPIGSMNTGVQLGETFTDVAPAGMLQTGQPLDFGIAGVGFFAVRTPQGVRYTRDGQFSTSASGQLVDGAGNTVLSQSGAPLRVGREGTVPPGALGVFNVPGAVKQGENLYTGTPAGRAPGDGALRGARGIRRQRRPHDGRDDRLAAHLPVRPAGHPGDRPNPPGRLHPGRLPQRVSLDPNQRGTTMLEGLYAAASGMEAQQQQLDSIGNNLANLSTTGYKAQRTGFRDLLYNQVDLAGTTTSLGAGAAAQSAGADHSQGTLQSTGNPLDLAIEGPGFFTVKRSNGTVALTRDGAFEVNARGQLTTAEGDRLDPPLTLPKGTSPSEVAVGPDGTVRVGTRTVGKLALVTVTAPDRLLADGSSLFSVDRPPPAPPGQWPAPRSTRARSRAPTSTSPPRWCRW